MVHLLGLPVHCGRPMRLVEWHDEFIRAGSSSGDWWVACRRCRLSGFLWEFVKGWVPDPIDAEYWRPRKLKRHWPQG